MTAKKITTIIIWRYLKRPRDRKELDVNVKIAQVQEKLTMIYGIHKQYSTMALGENTTG